MAEIETKTQDVDTTEQKPSEEEKSKEVKTDRSVDVEKVKGDAIAEYLKSLGVENSESLQAIVKKAKDDEEANKTDLQKKDDALTVTTKELAAEKEARIIAEAKLSAIQLGAKPELVDDLVIIAKSKVTKDKDINAVIAEMKDSTNGKIYFATGDEDETNKKGTVTRKRVTQNNQNKKDEPKTRAERIFANKKQTKKHYFS